MTTIKKNSRGTAVKVLQAFLELTMDGIFGKNTEAKVREYQKKKNLTADGIVGKGTWTAIYKELPNIKLNSANKYVYMWQFLLGITASGKFDSKTKTATISYQSVNKLSADGIVGPKTWGKAMNIVEDAAAEPSQPVEKPTNSSSRKSNTKPVYYKQGDPRWATKMYSSTGNKKQTYKNSACGPTSMAMVVATLWDKSILPTDMGALAVKAGYRSASGGTAWGFYKYVAEKYKCKKFIQTSSHTVALNAIKENVGALVICSVGKSRWTSAGHFIVWWDYDSKGYVRINDPVNTTTKRSYAPYKELKAARKQYFIFYPN